MDETQEQPLPCYSDVKTTNYTIPVAVDFGTSYSGFAFSIKQNEYTFVYKWPDSSVDYCKTRTISLYDRRNGECVAWGHTAKKKYIEQFKQTGVKLNTVKLCLFQNFKMGLFHDPDNPNKKKSEYYSDINNVLCNKKTIDLVTDYLHQVWLFLKEKLESNLLYTVKPSDISWCLSMPAIWRDREKGLMKEAAYKAGMLDSPNPSAEHYQCVLEPEAAAAYCMKFMEDNNGCPVLPGESILICDAGGGTVDITCYSVDDNKKLRELIRGEGNAFGSSKLDANFIQFLNNKFGSDLVDDLKDNYPAEWANILDAWEKAKCGVKDISKKTVITIEIPGTVVDKFIASVQENPDRKKAFEREAGLILVKDSDLRFIFEEALGDIINILKNFCNKKVEQDGSNFDYLFIVGGFAQSPILQEMLKDEFLPLMNKQVIVPLKPGEAIIRGCIILGREPSLIKSRKMRKTYGIETLARFNPDIHPNSLKVRENGIDYCDHSFSVHVQKDQTVEYDACTEKKYDVVTATQAGMNLNVFCCPDRCEGETYTTDTNMTKLGTLYVDFGNRRGLGRGAKVKMFFGQSEIKVEATDYDTADKFTTTIKYN